jgi:hypothetical protein
MAAESALTAMSAMIRTAKAGSCSTVRFDAECDHPLQLPAGVRRRASVAKDRDHGLAGGDEITHGGQHHKQESCRSKPALSRSAAQLVPLRSRFAVCVAESLCAHMAGAGERIRIRRGTGLRPSGSRQAFHT